MTREQEFAKQTEELEKEAEEVYQKRDREFMYCQDEGEIFTLGYIAGAGPREKRISELEKKNAELRKVAELRAEVMYGLRERYKIEEE